MHTNWLALTITLLEANTLGRHTKRFSGFSAAGIAGTAGCVVAGEKLFINGLYSRNLTSTEQLELEMYLKKLSDYKKEIKELDDKRRLWLTRKYDQKNVKANENTTNINFPKAPKKPSFCSAAETTQYYFEGCMVQNGKVYVGQEYVRDLSEKEKEDLKIFDAKMVAYQKHLTSFIQHQINSVFTDKLDLFNIFKDFRSRNSLETETTTTVATPQTTTTPVEMPEAPTFCITIY
ncbi:unnamed protein product [Thelazia callipaeda]|uniref:Pepsin-I3 domain-containing protein n=1 Tax=Thelazia callipaeda TaxID=103827 RepID=A0A0N5D4I5_THECL|nr:unnamed protein product [Thelazia callipaeda]